METVPLDEGLLRTTTSSGLAILSERLPSIRSAAVGVWVRSASAHEAPAELGISHLLEHMVFKGTERRSARELALALEERGGSLDAYTGRDVTSFQAHVLDADLPLAVEVLTDLVRRPLLREADLVPERGVILEEIAGVEDTPDDLVFDLHAQTLWPGLPYGHPILGTPDTVASIGADDLRARHTARYCRGDCVIAAAGNVHHDQLLTVLEREGWLDPEPAPAARTPVPGTGALRGGLRRETRDSAQAHLVLGTDTFPLRDPRRFALAILTNVFGGGMSSRLFQRIREELGLAYAVYAYKHFFQTSGQLGVYVGTQPATADRALEAIRAEFGRLAADGLTPAELLGGKQQLKGQIMLGLESPGSRMSRLAGFELHGDRYRSVDEVLADIDAVTAEEIGAVAAEFFAPERQTVTWLGPAT
ncbi:MAG TPA: pitrilysin family protein [Gemmatimonadales bacterium]|nr:pitrilysin family protein [Gemmatimonadales bacterium]